MLAGIAGLFAMFSFTPVGAASANLSRSYTATGNIGNGSLVSLDPKHSDQVQAADTTNGSRLLGVAVANDDSLLAVDATTGKVQVATSGTVNTLVSTLGGPIAVGDEIGVSPFSGIGMKATAGSRIIGLAQTSFTKGAQGSVVKTVTDKSGKKSQLTIGYVRVGIAIATDASAGGTQLNSLQKYAQSITGHSVSTYRVIVSLIVILAAILVLISLIYSAIYGSIISIGRNPLAKYAVFRTLGSVLVLAIVTALVAGVTTYFLLN